MADDDRPDLQVDEPPRSEAGDASEPMRGTVELPAVVLSEERQRMAPRRRLLPGLVDRKWLLYPSYLLTVLAGGITVHVALDTAEWHPIPVAIGWSMLFVWEWVYSAAYGYRRSLLKYFSATMVCLMTALLAFITFDKAAAQTVVTTTGLSDRGALSWLRWAGIMTISAGLPVLAHLVLLGRGYREKKET